MATLTDEAADRALADVPGWERDGRVIERTWTFPSFREAMAFVNRVADLAEAANHHPDIHVSWRTVRLELTTHDAGGLTDRDFRLAGRINALD